MLACNECKGTNISEQLWVHTNDYILKDGKTYYSVDFHLLDKSECGMYWCNDCNDETIPYDNEDKESEVA